MPVYAVTYAYTDDTAARDEHRPAHREYLSALAEKGINLCAGPFGPSDAAGGLLLFSAPSKDAAIAVTADDPFRIQGLVAEMQVREWLPRSGRIAPQFG